MVKLIDMNSAEAQASPAPPSLMAALMAGFDAITNHMELVLFPILLDLFLWFGPHLRMRSLIEGFLDSMLAMQGMDAPELSNFANFSQEFWSLIAERLNLFSLLRTYPVGVPSLMAGSQPIETPTGLPLSWDLSSVLIVVLAWGALTVVGLLVGTLYYALVADVALDRSIELPDMLNGYPRLVLQVVLLALFWVTLLFALMIPGSCFISLVTLTGLPFAQFALFLFGGFVIWVFFPLLFSAHGIFVARAQMWRSVRSSFRLTRLTLPKTAIFFVIIFVINEGLAVLWRVPAEGSWLTLVGVAGHGFVTTGLLAASFIYYRDAARWVERIIQQAKFSTLS